MRFTSDEIIVIRDLVIEEENNLLLCMEDEDDKRNKMEYKRTLKIVREILNKLK